MFVFVFGQGHVSQRCCAVSICAARLSRLPQRRRTMWFNHPLPRTAAVRRGRKRCIPCAGSPAELGSLAVAPMPVGNISRDSERELELKLTNDTISYEAFPR